MKSKPMLSFWQIWNMSFGFLGIQFGFALQGGFMSRIFQTLGAEKDALPLLWIAAPLTGLLVQPLIGYFSDRTWHPILGRRRPYFLMGAILASIALLFMPHSPTLWMAVGMLWVLDASINISMEPFRALVADKLPEQQRSYGFVLQTLIIGIGTWVASNLPWFVNQMGVSNEAAPGVVPASVKIAFAIGAFVFLASILVTVFTTQEYPPEDLERFAADKQKGGNVLAELFGLIVNMPRQMLEYRVSAVFQLAIFLQHVEHGHTGRFPRHVFKAPAPRSPAAFDMGIAAQAEAFGAANGAPECGRSGRLLHGLLRLVFDGSGVAAELLRGAIRAQPEAGALCFAAAGRTGIPVDVHGLQTHLSHRFPSPSSAWPGLASCRCPTPCSPAAWTRIGWACTWASSMCLSSSADRRRDTARGRHCACCSTISRSTR
ncbi:MAG: MFS transporter [Lysobacterales bacterium]